MKVVLFIAGLFLGSTGFAQYAAESQNLCDNAQSISDRIMCEAHLKGNAVKRDVSSIDVHEREVPNMSGAVIDKPLPKPNPQVVIKAPIQIKASGQYHENIKNINFVGISQ